MPLLSEFAGMKIYMYWDDHTPPHIHVEYANFVALVDIEKCVIIRGMLPSNKAKVILGWCELHREELKSAWETVKNHGMPLKIEPLE